MRYANYNSELREAHRSVNTLCQYGNKKRQKRPKTHQNSVMAKKEKTKRETAVHNYKKFHRKLETEQIKPTHKNRRISGAQEGLAHPAPHMTPTLMQLSGSDAHVQNR